MSKRIKYVLIILLGNIIFSQTEIFWDLGLIITENKIKKDTFSDTTKKLIKQKAFSSSFEEHILHNKVEGLNNKLNIITNNLKKSNEKSLQEKNKKSENEKTFLIDQKTAHKTFYSIATEAYRKEQYNIVLENLLKINIETSKKPNQIMLLIANTYYNMGQYQKAEEYLNTLSVQRFSEDADDAIILKAMILQRTGYTVEANQLYKQIMLDFPNSEFYSIAEMQTKKLNEQKQ